MKWFVALVLVVAVLLFFAFRGPPVVKVVPTLTVNGREPAPVEPGKPVELAFSFRRADGSEPLKAFELEHEKYMHLVVVSADLESYAHIHPVLDPGTGTFKLTLNQPIADPDSQDAARAMTRPGNHLLFSEIRPKDLGIYLHRFEVACGTAPAPAPLVVDAKAGGPAAVKYFGADSSPGKEGSPYRVSLTMGRGGSDANEVLWFEYHLSYGAPLRPGWQGEVVYKDIRDLELWLSMPGHAIMLGEAGRSVEEKHFRHIHAGHMHGAGMAGSDSSMAGSGSAKFEYPAGPVMLFRIPREDIPPPGVYKLWAQFRHKGRILTFPFHVRY
jgi:hypothetical protein